MLGIDTNVLMRCLVDTNLWPPDDAAQLAAAQRLLSDRKQKFFVNSIVLAESLWLLERRLKQAPATIVRVLEGLLGAGNVVLQDREAVEAAVATHARTRPGINDRLIVFVNLNAGCEATLTFDAAAALTRGFRLLATI
jgi:predicted nucleic-acid-binding protein